MACSHPIGTRRALECVRIAPRSSPGGTLPTEPPALPPDPSVLGPVAAPEQPRRGSPPRDPGLGSTLPPSFRRNALSSYLNTAATLVIALVTVPVLTRGLGGTEYGIWVLVGSLVLYLELFEFGFGTTTVRYVAAATARNDAKGAREAVSTSFWLLCVPGVLALGVGVVLAVVFPVFFHTDQELVFATRFLLVLLAIDLAISIPSDVFGGVLIALQRWDLLNLTKIIVSLSQAVGIVVVILLGGGLVTLGLTTVSLSLLGQLSRFMLGRQLLPGLSLAPRTVRRDLLKPYANTSIWFSLNEVSQVVIDKVDAIVVGAVVGVTQAGVYGVGQKLALLGARLVEPAIGAFFPHATTLAEQGEREALRSSVMAGFRIAAAVSFPPITVLVLLARPALDVWVGPRFKEAALVVVYLGLASAVQAIRSPAQLVVNGAGRLKVPALLNIAEAVVNLGLSVLLARTQGLTGVALATLLTTAGVTLLFFLPYACRELNLPQRTLYGQLLRGHLPPLALVVPLGLLARAQGMHGLLAFFAIGCTLGLLYLGVLTLTGLSPAERRRVLDTRAAHRGAGSAQDAGAAAPLRVLLVDPSAKGGIAVYSERVAEAVAAAGADVVLVGSANRTKPLVGVERRSVLPDQRWGRPPGEGPLLFYCRRLSYYLRVHRAVLHAVRDVRPDVLHLQAEVVRTLDRHLVRQLRRRCPVVLTAHDVEPLTGEALRTGWLEAADLVLVHSAAAAAVLASHGVVSRIVEHVPAAPAQAGGRAAGRRLLGLPEQGRLLVAAGFVRPYKGYPLLLDTWRLLGEKAPLLLVVGEAWGEQESALLDALAALPNTDVRRGYASDELLFAAVAAADAMLLPHEVASESGLLHLARALGTPVLASPLPQLAESVHATGAGVLVPRTAPDWARAVTGPLPPSPTPPPAAVEVGRAHLAHYERARKSGARLVIHTDAIAWGGAEIVLSTVVARLDPAWRVVVAGAHADVVRRVAESSGAAWRVIPNVHGKFDIRGIVRTAAAVRRLRADVALVNLRTPWAGQYFQLALRLAHVPTVAVEHLPMAASGGVQRRLKQLSSGWLSSHVAVSNAAAREVERLGGLGGDSVVVVRNGLPNQAVAPAQLPAGLVRPCLTAAGRLSEQKGFDVLLRALAQLPGVHLWLVGEGEARASLEALAAQLGVGDRVVMDGWNDQVPAVLGAGDLVVVPSRLEAWPLILVEALQAGLPVVASDIPGVLEVVGDGAVLVPPDDPQALADAIRELLADPSARRQLAERSAAVGAALPTEFEMAAAYDLLLSAAAGGPGSPVAGSVLL